MSLQQLPLRIALLQEHRILLSLLQDPTSNVKVVWLAPSCRSILIALEHVRLVNLPRLAQTLQRNVSVRYFLARLGHI